MDISKLDFVLIEKPGGLNACKTIFLIITTLFICVFLIENLTD